MNPYLNIKPDSDFWCAFQLYLWFRCTVVMMTINICKKAFREVINVFPFLWVQMDIWPSQSGRQTFSTIFAPRGCQHTRDSLEKCIRDNLAKGLCWLLCVWRSSSSSSSSSWMSHLIKSHNPRLPVVCCQIYKELDRFDPSCEWWI